MLSRCRARATDLDLRVGTWRGGSVRSRLSDCGLVTRFGDLRDRAASLIREISNWAVLRIEVQRYTVANMRS